MSERADLVKDAVNRWSIIKATIKGIAFPAVTHRWLASWWLNDLVSQPRFFVLFMLNHVSYRGGPNCPREKLRAVSRFVKSHRHRVQRLFLDEASGSRQWEFLLEFIEEYTTSSSYSSGRNTLLRFRCVLRLEKWKSRRFDSLITPEWFKIVF